VTSKQASKQASVGRERGEQVKELSRSVTLRLTGLKKTSKKSRIRFVFLFAKGGRHTLRLTGEPKIASQQLAPLSHITRNTQHITIYRKMSHLLRPPIYVFSIFSLIRGKGKFHRNLSSLGKGFSCFAFSKTSKAHLHPHRIWKTSTRSITVCIFSVIFPLKT
jgi:hypothetical protein